MSDTVSPFLLGHTVLPLLALYRCLDLGHEPLPPSYALAPVDGALLETPPCMPRCRAYRSPLRPSQSFASLSSRFEGTRNACPSIVRTESRILVQNRVVPQISTRFERHQRVSSAAPSRNPRSKNSPAKSSIAVQRKRPRRRALFRRDTRHALF